MSDDERAGLKKDGIYIPGGRTGILILHGLGGVPSEVRPLALRMAQAGLTVLCPKLKGHGGSALLLSTTTWEDWCESAERAFEVLRDECDTVIVAGQSAGALLALKLAAEHGKAVSGVILCSPTFWPDGWAVPVHFRLFQLVTTRWFAKLFKFRLRSPHGIKDERVRRVVFEKLQADRSFEDVIGRHGTTVFEFKKLAGAIKRKLASVTQPTLIFHSRCDDQAHVRNALAIAQGLSGPSEIVVLTDSYHLLTLDRERGIVAERSAQFVGHLAGRASKTAAVPSAPAANITPMTAIPATSA
ncbi:MAG: alpha/beta hydrolase [Hyphomicrobiaceae bacterium]